MNKYILLAVLALSIAAPSFVYAAEGAAPAATDAGKGDAVKKQEVKKVKKHKKAKKAKKAKAAAAVDAAPAADGNK